MVVGVIEDASPELLRAIHEFADQHDLGYTIHLNQSTWEVDYMLCYHGVRPTEYLHKHDFLGPRLFAAHCRYVDQAAIMAEADKVGRRVWDKVLENGPIPLPR